MQLIQSHPSQWIIILNIDQKIQKAKVDLLPSPPKSWEIQIKGAKITFSLALANKKFTLMYNFGPWKFFEWKFAPTIWIPRLFAGDGSKSTAGLKVLLLSGWTFKKAWRRCQIKNLFMSFCTIFLYVILGWYHNNMGWKYCLLF